MNHPDFPQYVEGELYPLYLALVRTIITFDRIARKSLLTTQHYSLLATICSTVQRKRSSS